MLYPLFAVYESASVAGAMVRILIISGLMSPGQGHAAVNASRRRHAAPLHNENALMRVFHPAGPACLSRTVYAVKADARARIRLETVKTP